MTLQHCTILKTFFVHDVLCKSKSDCLSVSDFFFSQDPDDVSTTLNELLKEQSKLGDLCDKLDGATHPDAKVLGPYIFVCSPVFLTATHSC